MPEKPKPSSSPNLDIFTKIDVGKAKNGHVSSSPPPKPDKPSIKPEKK